MAWSSPAAGRLNLRNARFADDPRPIDPLSSSPMARDYSRAYWRHLTKSGEILAMMGLTEINLAYYQDLMAGARRAIGEGRLDAYIAECAAVWAERRGESDDGSRETCRPPKVHDRRAEDAIAGGSPPFPFLVLAFHNPGFCFYCPFQ